MKTQRTSKHWAMLAVAALIFASTAGARSKAQIDAFRKENPCPITGHTRGPCQGYIVDHVTPLCAGGADHPSNMQWQTVEAAKIKDRAEAAQCRKR